MKPALFTFLVLMGQSFCSCAQSNSQKETAHPKIGGRCEGCEAVFESPVPFKNLNWVDTLPDYHEKGPQLIIHGIIYKSDGKTPASGVVLYVYHTDQKGYYSKKGGETGWARRHGYIRGWVKTNEKGEYQFYTLRPVSYPNSNIPAHIHPVIKEPDKNEYWIDEFLFDDDPLLTKEERQKQEQRGGSGILQLKQKGGVFYGERNIYLGKNIPDYPTPAKNQ
jgi:protocatechuate 3,4-dioxygenase beta subunit